MPPSSSVVTMTGPAALRALAKAFDHFGEFDNFIRGLQGALAQSELFERMNLRIDRTLEQQGMHFSRGALTVPLAGPNGRFGTLQAAPAAGPRTFGPGDLHLLAALADFLSATITQALNLEDAAKRRELLRFLLNQAPVGIAAYGDNRRLIVANDLANRWLADSGVPFEQLQQAPGGFHLRASGKLIYGEARRMADDASGSWIVVLQDLAGEQGRLLELIKRETYRALAEKSRLGFAFVESQHLADGVLRRLPELRAALLPGELAGPYDANRIGLVFPGLSGRTMRTRLRKLRGIFDPAAPLRLSYSELGRDGRTPEILLETALRNPAAYEEVLRPVLLVHDDSAAVADTFEMVLGREFQVVKSTSSDRTRELLASERFEGFVTELELRGGVSGAELVRYACEKQPGIRPFFTTVQRPPYGLPAGASAGDALILEKPFDIATLTKIVRDGLEG